MPDFAGMYGTFEASQFALVALAIVLVVSCISWVLAKQGTWHTNPLLMVFINSFIVVAAVTGGWTLWKAMTDHAVAHEEGVEALSYSPFGYWGKE